MTTDQATVGRGGAQSPIAPCPGPWRDLISSSGAAVTLTANWSGNFSGVVSVFDARNVALWVDYAANASGTTNYPQILIAVSAVEAEPAVGDDVWFAPSLAAAATPTAAGLTGTVVTGADYTISQNYHEHEFGGLVLRLPASSAGTDEYRQMIPGINVAGARWMYAAAIEKGDQSNVGELLLRYNLYL